MARSDNRNKSFAAFSRKLKERDQRVISIIEGKKGEKGLTGDKGDKGDPGEVEDSFETLSKNLKVYPYTLTYGVDGVDTIVYDLGGGLSITKTFNYTLGVLTSIVLSGDTPVDIDLTKTFHYTGVDLTSVTYS